MASSAPLAPDFIQFLFSNKPKFDCYFEVGNKTQGNLERIGAVKLMLMAHSEVFRLELEDSDLKEKGDVPVTDVHPDTFKGMLKYVYGHDTTSDLCFDEADNLLYVAEKYMIRTLKDKLAGRLMKLLNPDNICSLLNNPACYAHLELNSAITQILRYETDYVLTSPQFLSMNAEGFLKILEQDGLAVPEVELWRAAIKWAKHRANSEDGQLLRQQLSGFTQHLRLCTLTGDEFCGEVATTDVLTSNELSIICRSVGRKRKPESLTEICDEVVPRKMLKRPKELMDIFEKCDVQEAVYYSFTLTTKKCTIELLPLVCLSRDRNRMDPENSTYKVQCNITITKDVDNSYICEDSERIISEYVCSIDELPTSVSFSEDVELPTTVTFSEDVKYGVEFDVPLTVGGRNVTLLPNTKYTVKMKLNGYHKRYYRDDTGPITNNHLTLTLSGVYMNNRNFSTYYYFPSKQLQYRAITEQ